MALDLFKEKGVPLDRQVFTWKDMVQRPYSKLDDDAFTRVRVILMNGIESDALRFKHIVARFNRQLREPLALIRRVEQHQQTLVNWLNPADQSPVETTLGFEKDAIEGAKAGLPSSPGTEVGIAEVRQIYAREGDGLGSVPVPATLKGMFTTAKEMIKGNKPTVFIDKLGERAGFERAGVRLYEAALSKFDVHGTWVGGPSREQLEKIMNEELAHFALVRDVIEKLGADPTALTPSADLVLVRRWLTAGVAGEARVEEPAGAPAP